MLIDLRLRGSLIIALWANDKRGLSATCQSKVFISMKTYILQVVTEFFRGFVKVVGHVGNYMLTGPALK